MLGSVLADALFIGVIGLLIGSFLNVVIHRLPKMMEQQWAQEHAQYAEDAGLPAPTTTASGHSPITLSKPASRCPHCGHKIRWYENVPVLSYLFLRGKCAGCKAKISPRYPLVEIATGLLFFACAMHWGWTITTVAWCGFSSALVALAMIDWDTTLLPDDITLPLLWAGLIASATRITDVPLPDAMWGAVAGYLSLWLVYWGFKLATGKEGMGYGDFKLYAALGAWFGWQALVPIILMSSVIGAIVGIGLKLTKGLREGHYIPFGPFLAGAGLAVMLLGYQTIMRTILGWLGL